MTLADEGLPATFRVADAASRSGQRLARRLTSIELVSLIVAAATSAGTWRVGRQDLDVLGGSGALAFACALAAAAYRAHLRPGNRWFSGRAAAESLKTLAWRFAVCGEPFPASKGDGAAATALLERIAEIFPRLAGLSPPTVAPDAHDVTDAMLAARSLDFASRRRLYLEQRISDQVGWYTRREAHHRSHARRWAVVGGVFSVVGLVLGVLKFLGALDVDLLGIAAAVVTSASAWNNLNQHAMNAASYSVAARELGIIRDRGRDVDEASWASFVSDAEGAISREHTMWLARQGHGSAPA